MKDYLRRNKKAQISLEFIIFLAIFLLFFQSVIMQNIDFAKNVLIDTHNITISKENIDNLSNNIESFANSVGYGKRTMFFYLPASTKISCSSSPNKFLYEIKISDQRPIPSNCPNSLCNFEKDIFIGNKNLICNSVGPGFVGSVTIEKSSLGDINVSFQ